MLSSKLRANQVWTTQSNSFPHETRNLGERSNVFFAIKSGHTPHLGIGIARYQGESKIRLIGKKNCWLTPPYGGGPNPTSLIFSGMNIHLPAILGFSRCHGFDPWPYICLAATLNHTSGISCKQTRGQLLIVAYPSDADCSEIRSSQKAEPQNPIVF